MPPRFGVSSALAGGASASAAKSPAASDGRYANPTVLSLPTRLSQTRLKSVLAQSVGRRVLLHLAAGDPMAGPQLAQFRAGDPAFRDGDRAARVEDAARRRVD